MKIGRRRFVGFMAGAAAGSAIGLPTGDWFARLLASADSAIDPARGVEGFALSVCDLCPGGCGVRAREIGTRVVKLQGNKLHPISGGRLCPKGEAALQRLYHPDRITTPLRRVGPRGSIRSFRRASWDEALGEIAARLQALREERRPEALVVLRRDERTLGARLGSRFAEAFGTPNDIPLMRGEAGSALALQLTQGVAAVPAYDFRSADYIFSLGSEFLEASVSPVVTARAYGDFRQKRTARRGKLVQIDPRLSITASSADEWIPIRPGTHAVFALGVAAVIVSEGLYDRDFVSDHTTGFEEGAGGGLRRLLDDRFPLEEVAAQTGVSVNVILRVAREFAGSSAGLAVGPRKGPSLPGQALDHLAAHVLDALVGNIDQPGGVLVPEAPPLARWPLIAGDPIATEGRKRDRIDSGGDFFASSDPEQLAKAIETADPYRAEVLLLVGANPLLSCAEPRQFESALERVRMIVSIADLGDDSALHADWILPSAHFLERWEMHTNAPGVPFPLVSIAQPAVEKPLGEARPVAEIFLDLARRVGLEESFPWADVPSLLRAEMDGLYEARRGAIMGTSFDEAWVRMMENAGWWAPGYHSADELWTRALESGGWWDPFYDHGDWTRVLRTSSSRFDFRPDILLKLTEERTSLATIDGQTLALILFEPLPIAGGTGAELPFLQALLDPGHEERWETWGELHPETATSLGIADREWVEVASSSAAIRVRARVTTRVVPGAIAIPLGLGMKGGGRWAEGIGANPLVLVRADVREAVSGLPRFDAMTVRVAKSVAPRRA